MKTDKDMQEVWTSQHIFETSKDMIFTLQNVKKNVKDFNVFINFKMSCKAGRTWLEINIDIMILS